jgi:hypothetical protein
VNAALYRRARVLAGQWAGEPDAVPYGLATGPSTVPGDGPVVYVVGSLTNDVAYVGSSMTGAAGRLRAHLRESGKRRTWRSVWLIPLRPETPEIEVRRIEGRVGARLCPIGSRRLPRPFGPGSRDDRPRAVRDMRVP